MADKNDWNCRGGSTGCSGLKYIVLHITATAVSVKDGHLVYSSLDGLQKVLQAAHVHLKLQKSPCAVAQIVSSGHIHLKSKLDFLSETVKPRCRDAPSHLTRNFSSFY